MTIIQNTGIDSTVIVEKIVNAPENMGYDAMEGQMVDLMKAGIIDPTKVGNLITLYTSDAKNMSHLKEKPTMWFPTRSNTNRSVQLQKRARILKFRI